MEQTSDLGVIVTGIPHSGTTILSSLLKNHPKLMSGFELGVLSRDVPAEFPQVYQHMLGPPKPGAPDKALWSVQRSDVDRMTNATCLADMYAILREVSPYLNNTDQKIIDKCPGYVHMLPGVFERAPSWAKVIVSVKQGHRSNSLEETLANGTYNDRILEVNHTELLVAPHETMRSIFEFIGFSGDDWEEDFLDMSGLRRKLEPVIGETNARKIASHFKFEEDGGKCNEKRLARSHGKICHTNGARRLRRLAARADTVERTMMARLWTKLRAAAGHTTHGARRP